MNRQSPALRYLLAAMVCGLTAASHSGCKPPPPVPQAGGGQSQPAAAAQGASESEPQPPAAAVTKPKEELIDGLPKEVVDNVEQLIKLTAEYNAKAEKITDRQTYLDQSGSLAELENELSDYVQYMESAEAKLSPAQKATLDSRYFSRAKPLIDAKRKHKMRLVALLE